jgi:hypothetical protein
MAVCGTPGVAATITGTTCPDCQAAKELTLIETAPVEFEVYGLAEAWRREVLTMIDAGGGRPPWGVTVGHSDGTRWVEVTTFGRAQFDIAMRPEDDGRHELAFAVTHGQISRSLAVLTRRTIDSAPGLIRRLSEYAERQARGQSTWPQAIWTIIEGQTSRRVRTYTNSFAGWESGFTTELPEQYLVVHAFGTAIDDLSLSVVSDPKNRYGLDPARPRLQQHITNYFPPAVGQVLHADQLAALAYGPDPESRIVSATS